jgi:hypothetical protein
VRTIQAISGGCGGEEIKGCEVNKTAILVALILVSGGLLAVWLYTARTAYQIGATRGGAYIINRATGEAWFLVGKTRQEVNPLHPSTGKTSTPKQSQRQRLEDDLGLLPSVEREGAAVGSPEPFELDRELEKYRHLQDDIGLPKVEGKASTPQQPQWRTLDEMFSEPRK